MPHHSLLLSPQGILLVQKGVVAYSVTGMFTPFLPAPPAVSETTECPVVNRKGCGKCAGFVLMLSGGSGQFLGGDFLVIRLAGTT